MQMHILYVLMFRAVRHRAGGQGTSPRYYKVNSSYFHKKQKGKLTKKQNIRASDISWKKNQNFAGFSWKKSQNSWKNWLISQDFHGKKLKIHGKNRPISRDFQDFQGQILRKIGRFHGKFQGETSPRNNQ